MAKYCYFTTLFRKVRDEIAYIKENYKHVEGENVGIDLNFSSIKKQDPITAKLEESLKKVQNVNVEAWTFLRDSVEASRPQFVSMINLHEIFSKSCLFIQRSIWKPNQ
jgi:hypothetical protein